MVEKIYLKKFVFTLRADEEMNLPGYKGSMFRGAFGWAFRKTVCVTKAQLCNGCILTDHCLYFKYFETEIEEHTLPFLQGVQKTPHPFIILPPLDGKREYPKDSLFEVGLVIFGTASEYLPYFIHTFVNLGNEGLGVNRKKVSLIKVESVDINSQRETVFLSQVGRIESMGRLINYNDIINHNLINHNEVTLEFVTPLRIQNEGKVIMNKENITPQLLIRNIIRRCDIISSFYCEGSEEGADRINLTDIKTKKSELRFFDWERYSNRQKAKMMMGGFLGKITIEGKVSPLLPYILTGAHLNIGKHSMFGMGKYDVID